MCRRGTKLKSTLDSFYIEQHGWFKFDAPTAHLTLDVFDAGLTFWLHYKFDALKPLKHYIKLNNSTHHFFGHWIFADTKSPAFDDENLMPGFCWHIFDAHTVQITKKTAHPSAIFRNSRRCKKFLSTILILHFFIWALCRPVSPSLKTGYINHLEPVAQKEMKII